MNKIKDYFNKHNKLKKVAAILGIAAIILSFTFNAVIIATATIQHYKDKANVNEPIVYGDYKQHNKEAYYFNESGYYVEGSDFLYTTFVSNLLYKVYPTYDDRINNVQIIDQGLKIYVNAWYYFGESTPSHYNTIIQEVWLEPRTPIVNAMNYYTVPIDITFYGYDSQGVSNFEYTIVYNYLPCKFYDAQGNLRNNYISNGVGVFDFASNVNFNSIDGYLMFNYQDNQHYWLLLNGSNNVIYETTYIQGYEDGYRNGESVGYDNGYQAGSTGLTSNPFNLIKNAFDAVANILNIQVLPNLSLGVIIFTPLIVTIIIVVVKFIRG